MQNKKYILGPEEYYQLEQVLKLMVDDNLYSTQSSYSCRNDLYPDNLIPFVEKHLEYLRKHPNIDPNQYLSNLKLMTKKR